MATWQRMELRMKWLLLSSDLVLGLQYYTVQYSFVHNVGSFSEPTPTLFCIISYQFYGCVLIHHCSMQQHVLYLSFLLPSPSSRVPPPPFHVLYLTTTLPLEPKQPQLLFVCIMYCCCLLYLYIISYPI